MKRTIHSQDRAVHHGRHQTYFTPPFCDLSRFETSRENSRKSRENSRTSRETSTGKHTASSITGDCATSDPPAFSQNTCGGGWEDVAASVKKKGNCNRANVDISTPPAGSAPSPVVVAPSCGRTVHFLRRRANATISLRLRFFQRCSIKS